jgi:4-amino-4-deoxy-L-arabinose transferase-like glycosyltransferase
MSALVASTIARWAVAPRRAPAIAALYGAVLLAYLAWQLWPASLGVFAYTYDEGLSLQTAWALQRGYRLYDEIFSSHPPLLPYVLGGLFALTGPSVAVAREAIVLLSLLALAGVALLAWRGGGWLAGLGAVALLAFSPGFAFNARTIATEAPALALTCLALGVAGAGARPGPLRWLATGLLLALATLTKLSALVCLPALLILLLARPAPFRSVGSVGALARDALLLATPLLLLGGLLLTQVDLASANDQVLALRASAREAYGWSITANLRMMTAVVRAQPHAWLLALIGAVALAHRRQWSLLAMLLALLAAALLALATHSPLFEHHLGLPLPAVAALGGVGLAAAATALLATLRTRGQALRRPMTLLPALGLAAALALIPWTAAALQRETPDAARSWEEPARGIAALQELPAEIDTVLLDDQMMAFVAARATPPELIDASRVRISSGYLEPDYLIGLVEAEPPDAIMLWSGRLRRVPGFRQWVRDNYHLYLSLGDGQELYLRR